MKTMTNQRQLNKQETRRQLLNAGLELFSENGYDKTHAFDIANKANVAVGTLYLHFGDKEGLLQQIIIEATDEIHRRVQQIYERPFTRAEDQARAHVEAIVEYVEENQQNAAFVLRYIMYHAGTCSPWLDRIITRLGESIRFGQEQGIYREDIDAMLAARAEANMNLGVLSWWANNPKNATRQAIIDTLTKFRLSGLHRPTISSHSHSDN